MAFIIHDRATSDKLSRILGKARQENANSLEKLSSGEVFTKNEPKPADRALAERLELRLRRLAASKRNINDAISLLQTAEEGFAEINNMMTRMKEINIAAASTTVDERDRRYLFIEYEALFDEINRISLTTEFNGIPLLNGESEQVPESLIFRVDDPMRLPELDSEDDINIIRFDGVKEVNVTTAGLGLRSAKELLEDSAEEGGIELEDVQELLLPEDDDLFSTVYEEAQSKLSAQRAVYGALQTRLNKALDYSEVYGENIAAARSKIADTDYAREVSKLAKNNVLMQATTGLLAQNNINANLALNLISSAVNR